MMKVALYNLVRPLLVGVFVIGTLAAASGKQAASPQADNTKINNRDRDANQPTADQQKETRSDRELSQQIRKAIANDKSLSTYAHNVKVITQNGTVTLKGPVKSEEEKKAVEAKAAEIAGEQKVTSQLEIKSKD